MSIDIVHLDVCESTQDEARARLRGAPRGATVAVIAQSQTAGRGRGGRRWEGPPGTAVLLSVARTDAGELAELATLPRRIGSSVRRVLGAEQIAWKEPNDLVCSDTGAKVAGILVDVRTTAAAVDEIVVGIGLNATGEPFVTSDGRLATSVAACTGTDVSAPHLAERIVTAICACIT